MDIADTLDRCACTWMWQLLLFDFLQWSHDCNLTLFALLRTLQEVTLSRSLPSKLLLQMDNWVRENKNKFVFGFLSLLVELNIFSEVGILRFCAHELLYVIVYICRWS